MVDKRTIGLNLLAPAQYICLMLPDADDFVVSNLDFQSATGFAQRANAVVGGLSHTGLAQMKVRIESCALTLV
jgi:hypothetical protein